jgi:hypothetical protein
MSKTDIIEKVYYDLSGYGSIQNTLKEARKYDSSITYDDVKTWKEKQFRKRQLRGTNSFIAEEPLEEFQMDLLFFSDVERGSVGLLMVDIFTKYTYVVELKSKQPPDVLDGIKKCFDKMGVCKTIYCDNEGAFVSNIVKEFLNEKNVKLITTNGHAPVAERQIRTIKNMIYQRMEKTGKTWRELLYPVLLVYNHKLIHSVIKMTPADAMKKSNSMIVRMNLELRRKNSRLYPEVDVGDKVKVFKKKDKLDKERVSNWSAQSYTVLSIDEYNGQKLYKLEGLPRSFVRSDILLVD